MTDFSDIKADVAAITNRPDKADLEASKINAAVRLISLSGKYWQDLQEVTLEVADGIVATAYVQSITLPARFRHVLYVSYADPANNPHIKPLSAESIVLKKTADDTNICYTSGSLLHIRNSVLSSTLLFGYYSYPAAMAADTDTNWIIELMPSLVADLAATLVLTSIGNTENANLVQAVANGQLGILVKDAMDSYEANVDTGRA